MTTEELNALIAQAEIGDISAMNQVAHVYSDNVDFKDPEKAYLWYKKSAELGNVNSMANLGGWSYLQGNGIEKNIPLADEWLKKSVDNGWVWTWAFNELANKYANDAQYKDLRKAFYWYSKSAEAGDAVGMANLGWCYLYGNGTDQNLKLAVEWLEKAAAQGNVWSMNKLIQEIYSQDNECKDYKRACSWIEKRAENDPTSKMMGFRISDWEKDWLEQVGENDILPAVSLLARHYEYSDNAFVWAKKGAEAGDVKSIIILAECYEQGRGVEKDYRVAAEWYEKAANMGDIQTYECLANLYQVNLNDSKKAFFWMSKGAEAGSVSAMNGLGHYYYQGIGVEKNIILAIEWLAKAVEKGDTMGLFDLGLLYSIETPLKNYEKAFACWQKAVETSHSIYYSYIWYCDLCALQSNHEAIVREFAGEVFGGQSDEDKKTTDAINKIYDAIKVVDKQDIEELNKLNLLCVKDKRDDKAEKKWISIAQAKNYLPVILQLKAEYRTLRINGKQLADGMGFTAWPACLLETYYTDLAATLGDSDSALEIVDTLLAKSQPNYTRAIELYEGIMAQNGRNIGEEHGSHYFDAKKRIIKEQSSVETMPIELCKLAEQCKQYGAAFGYDMNSVVSAIYEEAGKLGSAEALFQLGQLKEDTIQLDASSNQEALNYYRRAAALGHQGAANMYAILNSQVTSYIQTRQTDELRNQMAEMQRQMQESKHQAEEAQRATEAELKRQLEESRRQTEEAKRQAAEAQREAEAEQQRASVNRNPEIDVVIVYDYATHYTYYPDLISYDVKQWESMRESEYIALKGNYDALCAHIKGKYLDSNTSILNARIERDD